VGGGFLSEWPGGSVGGDTERRNVAVPEPTISSDGIYQCPQCGQGFVTRQNYVDHYVAAHTNLKVEKNYVAE